jgi:basic amino acid/polyamine antiporter, APA family
VPRRRREQHGLQRVLGAPALFATVYGNVGSSIYYALGVTAAFALGLTPLVFLIAGVIFAATTLTYAEGTVRFPEAGGSSSFARHAFNEVVSFGAAWAQMLNYIITIAISAFFVPHYLSIFWGPLKTTPWDIIVGAAVIVFLVLLNIVGIREAAKLNIGLAVIDFATQLLLVLIGFALIFSPHTLTANVHWGVAPTWGNFLLAIPIGMVAYTGIETVSNLAEEARDPARNVPRAYLMTVVAVFAIYFTLPAIALTALPVHEVAEPCKGISGNFQTQLACPPPEGFQNDPVLGLVENLGISNKSLLDTMKVYVGILAATILFIGTNAGVIGASRITYAMAHYRQLPQVFRRVHPRFRTPWIALIFFAGLVPVLTLLPGKVDFLSTMYSFGAMLSFTIAHLAVITLRARDPSAELVFRGRPNLRIGRVDWPVFAFVGLLGTALAWLTIVIQTPNTRYAGLGWLAAGFVAYWIYRRWILKIPLAETVEAPAVILGPSLIVEYQAIVVPILRTAESEEALIAAARLAAERRATIAIVRVVEVPLDLDLDASLPEEERRANRELDDAQALVENYGVHAVSRLVRARSAGPAIVEEVRARNAELVVVGAMRRIRARGSIFGSTVAYVLRESPARVMVAGGRRAA